MLNTSIALKNHSLITENNLISINPSKSRLEKNPSFLKEAWNTAGPPVW